MRTRILFVLLIFACAPSLRAQIAPYIPPPPPPPEKPSPPPVSPSTPPPPPPSAEAPAASSETDKPVFDPYHAQRSLDVGTFYLKKGNYDAAIDRFQEAAHYQPSLAMPWKLMGEAYGKQHEYAKAIESYKKYLDIFPHAEDAAKIAKEISTLEEKTEKDTAKGPPH